MWNMTTTSTTTKKTPTLRSKIVKVLANRQTGLTTEQLTERLGSKHQSVSAAVSELITNGKLIFTGKTRITSSGRPASIVTVAPLFFLL